MAARKRKRKRSKSTGHVHTCAVTLGRRGGKTTARKRRKRSMFGK